MHLNESLTGIRVVKAFAQEDHENAKFTRRNQELRDAGVRADTRWYTIFGVDDAVHQPGRAHQLDRRRRHGLPPRR